MPSNNPLSHPARVGEIQPVADLSKAPLPTAATLRRRNSLLFQLGRFLVFNLRILRMAGKGHR